MSDENDIIASCQFKTEAVTRIVAKFHRLRWTIENVSLLCKDDFIKGPKISFSKTCMCRLIFQKVKGVSYIVLSNSCCADLSIKKAIFVLMDCDGQKLDVLKFPPPGYNITLGKGLFCVTEVEKEKLESLKDDKLIINCRLKVTGSVKIKSISMKFNKVKVDSEKKLLNDVKAMFNNPDSSDFKLQVEDNVIHAHKTVLNARSEYFKKMFLQAQMKENILSSVHVTDVPYLTLTKLVQFLYTGDFTLTEEDDKTQQIFNLYIAADKYQVLDLKSLCADKLIFAARIDNILGILQLAERHSDEKLKFEAMQFISFNWEKVVKSNDWKTLMVKDVDLASEVIQFCVDN